MMRRPWVPVAVVLICLPTSAFAKAEEGEEEHTSNARPAKDVGIATTCGAASLTWIDRANSGRQNEVDSVLQLAGWYHMHKSLSMGGVASYWTGGTDHQIWRASGEARLFAVTSRFFYLWGAGEAGLAMSMYTGSCPDCGVPPDTSPRVAPLVGVGAGFDLLPIREISIGFEGRAILPIFIGDAVGDGPTGISAAFMAGVVLALHLPTT